MYDVWRQARCVKLKTAPKSKTTWKMKTTLKKRMTKNVVNPEKENGHKHCARGEGGLIIFYFFLLFLQICHNILLKDMPWNNETNTKTGIENSVNTWSQQPKSWISKPRPWVSLKCPPGCFAFWDTGNAAMLVFSLDPRTSCIFFKINFCICASPIPYMSENICPLKY